MAVWAQDRFRFSQRRACRALGVALSSVRYRSVRPPQEPLRRRIHEIASARVSYGYRRVHVLLRREGWRVNLKRVLRLYREEGLCLRSKKPKRRRSAVPRIERPAGRVPNERWSMDFMSDALASGHRLRVLTVLDSRTRECVALEVATGFGGHQVAEVLTRVGVQRGLASVITVDHGTECWTGERSATRCRCRPRKPPPRPHRRTPPESGRDAAGADSRVARLWRGSFPVT